VRPSLKEIADRAAAKAERQAICLALRATRRNKSEAARLLRVRGIGIITGANTHEENPGDSRLRSDTVLRDQTCGFGRDGNFETPEIALKLPLTAMVLVRRFCFVFYLQPFGPAEWQETAARFGPSASTLEARH